MSNKELTVGAKAPVFSLPDKDGRNVSLADLGGKWAVLYFYPKDSTPGCTIEANDFTRLLDSFNKLNCRILGVSPDSAESHCSFTEKEGLKITLLSDTDKKIMKKYGAWGMKNMYGKKVEGVIRSTVIIDPDGKIAYHWKKVKAAGHAEKVLEKLKVLQLG